jgi:hypothetical protein
LDARAGGLDLIGDLRADPRIFDPAGEAAWVSLIVVPEALRPPFDDLAIQQARRRVLAEPPPDAVSTLLADDSRFAGAITVRRGDQARALLADDPFARIHPARIVAVQAGIFGVAPPPTGPTIERHGSARPWPWDRFA